VSAILEKISSIVAANKHSSFRASVIPKEEVTYLVSGGVPVGILEFTSILEQLNSEAYVIQFCIGS
jgi:hypothetical protein